MNEARRFIRYITPGFLFGSLMFFMLWITLPEWTASLLKRVLLVEKSSLAIIIGSIFTSGALGYLFATIHHWCHWHLPFDRSVINHTNQIASLREKCFIDPRPIDAPTDTQLEALITISTLWFQRLGADSLIGNSENRVAAYGDLAHAAGTARVASFFALLMTVIICMLFGEWNPTRNHIIRYVIMVVFGCTITLLFHDAWSRTGKISQQINDRILEDALKKERAESKEKKQHNNNATSPDGENSGGLSGHSGAAGE